MAQPHYVTKSYASTHLVESCGAIQFLLPSSAHSRPRVVLVHNVVRDCFLLAKGRRNLYEHRAATALREVAEETGLVCRHGRITLHSRCPPEIEITSKTPNTVRRFEDVVGEPFMIQTRDLGRSKDGLERLKLIWWFIAFVDEERTEMEGKGPEEGLVACAVELDEAVDRLTFECDREVVRKAIEIFRESYK